jgi:uncharacterized protein
MQNSISSPFARIQPIKNSSVNWTGGFWAEWSQVCRDVMVPSMWRLLANDEICHAYANFRIAAELEAGDHQGPKWHDGDFYKWLEAACSVYETTRDEELNLLLDQIIALIARVQRADGYIHTPTIIAARNAAGVSAHSQPEFQERLHFETYNMGHLMTAACVHYEATGKITLLNIARKAADFLERFYQSAAPELARNAICPSHYMGVVDLYRTTGEPRYLELAKNLVEIRGLVNGGDDNQDRVPLRDQEQVVGHAVRANYLYAGVADLYAETGDRTLLETLERLWQNVTLYKMYITGGCGALYDGASPDGSVEQSQITRVHQAYGREYQLPNTTAHNETCANIGNVMWNWRMLNITGEARYADVMELALYNSVLSGISLDGKRFFYTNPLRKVKDLPFDLRWAKTREEYISCFCCPPNLVRTIAQVGKYAYATAENQVWVHLYGSSRVDFRLASGAQVNLAQETEYPFDGQIKITVELAEPAVFDLLLHIPGWATGANLAVNGEPFAGEVIPGTYLALMREWASGDSVTLDLKMPPQLIEAHPFVEETRSQLAIQRGPLVYCLEAVDLPEGVRVVDVHLQTDGELSVDSDPELERLLPGIKVLRGKVYVNEAGEAWQGKLYRAARSTAWKEIEVTFVPYFAWDNRGDCEMTVWMPRR